MDQKPEAARSPNGAFRYGLRAGPPPEIAHVDEVQPLHRTLSA